MKYINKTIWLTFLVIVCFSHNVAAEQYNIGARAHHGVDEAKKQWQPTIDALNYNIPAHHFVFIPIINIPEITQRTKDKELDFILTNPSSFVEIKEQYGAKALVTLNNKRADTAQSQFGSVIFTHAKNTDILTLKDLENKSLMAVSKSAFGGWLVAWMEMLKQGFNPQEKLKALRFTENSTQPEVVKSVLSRTVDAGVVRTDLLEKMESQGLIDMRYLRIINNKDINSFPFFLSTSLYPEWAFAASRHIPTQLANEVKMTLLNITTDSKAARSGKYVGWIPAKDYQSVKSLMKQLRFGPYEH